MRLCIKEKKQRKKVLDATNARLPVLEFSNKFYTDDEVHDLIRTNVSDVTAEGA